MKEPEYRKRKPDFETESFRVWKTKGNKEKEEVKQFSEKNPIKVKQGKFEMVLQGFTKLLSKKTGKPIMAYKIKREEKLFMYWIEDEDKLEDNEIVLINNTKQFFRNTAELFGYGIMDMKEQIKRMANEKHVLEKL